MEHIVSTADNNNAKEKYNLKDALVRVFAESIIIVFSVLFALWIDNNTEQSGNTKLRADLYQRLYTDVKNDSTDFANFLGKRKKAENSINTLIGNIHDDTISNESLAALFLDIEWFPPYRSNNSTYSSILNAGHLKLFEQDTLFIGISSYYTQNDAIIELSEAYAAGSNKFLVPYINEHFDRRLYVDNSNQHTTSIDLSKFKSREFLNLLYCIRDRLGYERNLLTHHERQIQLLAQMRVKK